MTGPRQDKIKTWLAGAGQNPRTVASGNFAEGSNSKWVKAKPLACSPLQAYAQAVDSTVVGCQDGGERNGRNLR